MVVLARVARPHAAVLGRVPDLAGMHDIGEYPTATQIEGLLVFRYDSPLFFANAEDFRIRVLDAVREQQDRVSRSARAAQLRGEVDADSTAVGGTQALVRELQRAGSPWPWRESTSSWPICSSGPGSWPDR